MTSDVKEMIKLMRDSMNPFKESTLYDASIMLESLNNKLDECIRMTNALVQFESIIIEHPEYHYEAMGCGLEDRNITDRYEAMKYGFECAVDKMYDQLPEELYVRVSK